MKTKYIVADFSNGKEIYDEIEQQLSGIPVGILGKLLNDIIFSLFERPIEMKQEKETRIQYLLYFIV